MTFLSLLNPVVAAVLGWIVLDQTLNGWQIVGAVIVLVSVVLGQDFRLRRGQSGTSQDAGTTSAVTQFVQPRRRYRSGGRPRARP